MTREIPSVWARPKKGREQPALSREQIVSEAIKLLDTDGLDALSMRNLGKRLYAGATSLYRHVVNKDELIELAIDEVYGEIEVPSGDDWRAGVISTAQSVRAMITRHPWVGSVLGQVGLSYLGPNVIRMSDKMLALFEQGGFGLVDGNRAMRLVLSYVIGAGIGEAAWLTSLARSGLSDAEWAEQVLPLAKQAAAPYPRLLAALDTPDTEDLFAYGLDALLDGLVAKRP